MSHEDDKTGILPVPCMYKPCCLLSQPASAFFTGPAIEQRNYCCWVGKGSPSSEKDLIFDYHERLPRRDDGPAIEGRTAQLCTYQGDQALTVVSLPLHDSAGFGGLAFRCSRSRLIGRICP